MELKPNNSIKSFNIIKEFKSKKKPIKAKNSIEFILLKFKFLKKK
jgi:hypothetical protein